MGRWKSYQESCYGQKAVKENQVKGSAAIVAGAFKDEDTKPKETVAPEI